MPKPKEELLKRQAELEFSLAEKEKKLRELDYTTFELKQEIQEITEEFAILTREKKRVDAQLRAQGVKTKKKREVATNE